jgi:hypothetical protein
MRETCTSGSVRGEDGDILTYSAGDLVNVVAIEVMKTCICIRLQRTLEVL